MDKLIYFLFTFTAAWTAAAEYQAEIVKTWTLPADFKINKKKVGGLSGCSIFENRIYLVSDDRGSQGGPRIISFKFNPEKNEIDFNDADVTRMKLAASQKILDLEGIGMVSRDRFLLSTEGDLNQRPRVMPEIFWANRKGEKTSMIQFPKNFLPEKSGKQTRGIQLNQGFEGLVIDTDLKKWAAILEAPLMQGPKVLSVVESDLDSMAFDRIYSYPQPVDNSPGGLSGYFGASAMLFLNEANFLILERGVEASLQGLTYRTQLCTATKAEGSVLNRSCFYSMNGDAKLLTKFPNGANFEGLCWVNKQKKLLLIISDNNFSKTEKSVFILYQLN